MKKATVLFCIFMATIALVYAVYWIYSTIVHVPYQPPQYKLTLEAKQTSSPEC